MFNLTLHDHLHLTFVEIIQRQRAHAAKARSHARWSRRLRGGEAVLIAGVAIAASGAAFRQIQALAVVAAVLAGIALIILIVNLSFNFDASARAHATCTSQLWGLRERYRSLLSDLHDGAITLPDARLRRDKLLDELRSIYDTTSLSGEQDAAVPPLGTEEGAPSSLNTPRLRATS